MSIRKKTKFIFSDATKIITPDKNSGNTGGDIKGNVTPPPPPKEKPKESRK